MMRSRTLENLAKREEKKRETEEGRRNPIIAGRSESPKQKCQNSTDLNILVKVNRLKRQF